MPILCYIILYYSILLEGADHPPVNAHQCPSMPVNARPPVRPSIPDIVIYG